MPGAGATTRGLVCKMHSKNAHTSIQVQPEGARHSLRKGEWGKNHRYINAVRLVRPPLCPDERGATSVQRDRTLTERVQATNQRAPALADVQIEFWRK